jgi:hypothetical protein
LTIHVGLGTGGRAQQLIETQLLIGAQEKGVAAGLVSKRNLFASAKKLVRVLGDKDVETYFVDPSKPPDQNDPASAPIPPPQDPAMLKIQADAQSKQQEMQFKGQELQAKAQIDQQADERKAQIESVQAQADIATQDRKTQAELMMAERKAQLEERLMLLEHELKMTVAREELQMKREIHQHTLAQNQMGMVATAQSHEAKMEQMKAKGAE